MVTPIDAPGVMPTLLGLSGLAVPESVQDEAEPAGLLNPPASFSVVRRLGMAEYRGGEDAAVHLRTVDRGAVAALRQQDGPVSEAEHDGAGGVAGSAGTVEAAARG